MKNKNKLRVLCLDTEGGYGGSSRSLFNSVANLDNSKVDVEVWCKRSGIIQSHYKNIGIKVKVMPGMPKITALPKLSRNLFEFGVFLIRDWPKSIEFRKELFKLSLLNTIKYMQKYNITSDPLSFLHDEI